MDTRGWQRERKVPEFDLSGRPVPIYVGLTSKEPGLLVPAIAVGPVGPTAVLTDKIIGWLDRRLELAINFGKDETMFAEDTLGRATPIRVGRAPNWLQRDVPILRIGGVEGTAVVSEDTRRRLGVAIQALQADVSTLHAGGVW